MGIELMLRKRLKPVKQVAVTNNALNMPQLQSKLLGSLRAGYENVFSFHSWCFWLIGKVPVSDSNSWLFNHCWLHDHAFMTLCVGRKKWHGCSWNGNINEVLTFQSVCPSTVHSVQSVSEHLTRVLASCARNYRKFSQGQRRGCQRVSHLCHIHALVHLPPEHQRIVKHLQTGAGGTSARHMAWPHRVTTTVTLIPVICGPRNTLVLIPRRATDWMFPWIVTLTLRGTEG